MTLKTVRLCTLTATLLWASTGGAWVQSVSSKGAGLHWDHGCVSYYLHEQGSDDVEGLAEKEALKASLAEWSAPTCSAMTMKYAGTTDYDIVGFIKEEDPINLVLWHESDWPYPQRPIAYTSVTYDPNTGVIMDADLELNGEDYAFTVDPKSEPFKIDIQNTVTHELGHALGLDHTTDPFSTMYLEAMPGETIKRTLEADDIAGLCALYPIEGGLDCDKPSEEEPGGSNSVGCALAASASASWLFWLLVPLGLVRLCRRKQ